MFSSAKTTASVTFVLFTLSLIRGSFLCWHFTVRSKIHVPGTADSRYFPLKYDDWWTTATHFSKFSPRNLNFCPGRNTAKKERKKENNVRWKDKTMLRWGKVSYFTWVTRTVHIWLTNLRPTECPFYPRLYISVYGYSKLLSATRRGKTSKQRGNTWETNSEPSSQKAAQ